MLESIEHSLQLKDGRILTYHTFPKAEYGNDEDTDISADVDNNSIAIKQERHPVLYFHGCPGCGLEGGAVSALSVARAGGRLFAVDRPGMGKMSSPYIHHDNDNNDNAPDNLDTFVENIWELIEDRGWNDFSVIGVSGGGPYTLALLASYLERRQRQRKLNEKEDGGINNTATTAATNAKVSSCARLRNVCLVGAICASAGLDGAKKEIVQLATSRMRRRLGGVVSSLEPPHHRWAPSSIMRFRCYRFR